MSNDARSARTTEPIIEASTAQGCIHSRKRVQRIMAFTVCYYGYYLCHQAGGLVFEGRAYSMRKRTRPAATRRAGTGAGSWQPYIRSCSSKGNGDPSARHTCASSRGSECSAYVVTGGTASSKRHHMTQADALCHAKSNCRCRAEETHQSSGSEEDRKWDKLSPFANEAVVAHHDVLQLAALAFHMQYSGYTHTL